MIQRVDMIPRTGVDSQKVARCTFALFDFALLHVCTFAFRTRCRAGRVILAQRFGALPRADAIFNENSFLGLQNGRVLILFSQKSRSAGNLCRRSSAARACAPFGSFYIIN